MKSSVGRATEIRPTQEAQGTKDTAHKTIISTLAGGRSKFFWACQVSLRSLQPIEPDFNSQHVQYYYRFLL
ncbi:MAG: hypothetical protein WCZ89_07105 [Phycisphaerae bacterium]